MGSATTRAHFGMKTVTPGAALRALNCPPGRFARAKPFEDLSPVHRLAYEERAAKILADAKNLVLKMREMREASGA